MQFSHPGTFPDDADAAQHEHDGRKHDGWRPSDDDEHIDWNEYVFCANFQELPDAHREIHNPLPSIVW